MMKRSGIFALIAVLVIALGIFVSVKSDSLGFFKKAPTEIKWMSMKEAMAANAQEKKAFFIDVYTDWCGWCKVMDRETFAQPEVAAYMMERYYCVKLNAEKDEPIIVNGQEFKLVDAGQRQIHTLAYALLDGQLSYPSYVFLNGDLQRTHISVGFKKPDAFLAELNQIVSK